MSATRETADAAGPDADAPGSGTTSESAGPKQASFDEAFRQVGTAGREGLSAALDSGRALRNLVLADVALARTAAARALAWTGVAIAFGASSWLLLMAALIALMQRLGWSWLASLSLAAGLSLLITGIGIWQTLRYFEYTRLDATRRQLARLGLGDDEKDED